MQSLTYGHDQIRADPFGKNTSYMTLCVLAFTAAETDQWFQVVTAGPLHWKVVLLLMSAKQSWGWYFGTLQILRSPSTFPLITLAFLADHCINQLFHPIRSAKWWFFYLFFFCTLISRDSVKKEKEVSFSATQLPGNSVQMGNIG